jgi:hypothetical protein
LTLVSPVLGRKKKILKIDLKTPDDGHIILATRTNLDG